MKIHELKELPLVELERRMKDLLEEHQNFRFQHATRQLDNPLRLRYVRRDIARIQTLLKEYASGKRQARQTAAL